MKSVFTSPKLILPLAVVLGLFVLTMRVADMWDTVASGRLSVRPALAEEAQAPKAAKETGGKEAPAAKAAEAPAEPAAIEPPVDTDASPAELEVLKQLSERREQLEKRSRDMDSREALLKVTEQRVDQKVKEMDALRQQLQALVNQGNEAQQQQLDNLVKIYETMKPDEAARIFETLDMQVVLGVIQRMKPARTAPVLAKMNPEKAKEITTALTKRDQLPQEK